MSTHFFGSCPSQPPQTNSACFLSSVIDCLLPFPPYHDGNDPESPLKSAPGWNLVVTLAWGPVAKIAVLRPAWCHTLAWTPFPSLTRRHPPSDTNGRSAV